MKLIAISFAFLLSVALPGFCAKTIEEIDIESAQVTIILDSEANIFTIMLSDDVSSDGHSVISLSKMQDLSYKTRVMRYFGGLLKASSYDFKTLKIYDEDGMYEFEFNRSNISMIVNKMCQKSDQLSNYP